MVKQINALYFGAAFAAMALVSSIYQMIVVKMSTPSFVENFVNVFSLGGSIRAIIFGFVEGFIIAYVYNFLVKKYSK